jgi:hypothetical protein
VLSPRVVLLLSLLVSLARVPSTNLAAIGAAEASAAPSVNLDQCGKKVSPCAWQHGDLNGSNSVYHENDVVPFRLSLEGPTPNTQHPVHINYDFTTGGRKAFDFLATVDATQTVDVCAPGGGGVPSVCTWNADLHDYMQRIVVRAHRPHVGEIGFC